MQSMIEELKISDNMPDVKESFEELGRLLEELDRSFRPETPFTGKTEKKPNLTQRLKHEVDCIVAYISQVQDPDQLDPLLSYNVVSIREAANERYRKLTKQS